MLIATDTPEERKRPLVARRYERVIWPRNIRANANFAIRIWQYYQRWRKRRVVCFFAQENRLMKNWRRSLFEAKQKISNYLSNFSNIEEREERIENYFVPERLECWKKLIFKKCLRRPYLQICSVHRRLFLHAHADAKLPHEPLTLILIYFHGEGMKGARTGRGRERVRGKGAGLEERRTTL